MDYFWLSALILNAIAILVMIFIERKKPEIIVSWLLLFCFIPVLGFVLYVLIGGGLSINNRKLLKRKNYYNDNYDYFCKALIDEKGLIKNEQVFNLIKYNLISSKSVPTFKNKVKFFIDGKNKIKSLINDIKNAKSSINMDYYIFADDIVGKEVMSVLIEKAQQGVKIKLIYDSVGCLGTSRRFFKKLKKAGGEVREFFPPLFGIRLINFKMNYRNHRKLAIIDGVIGYVGGINIRKDHMGLKKKVSPWRDAHIRLIGESVYSLQNQFLNFWDFCNKRKLIKSDIEKEVYFPNTQSLGKTIVQVLTSGPDLKENEIRDCMIKMINLAEEKIVIQTPYFIPDDIVMNSLKIAIQSGIKVIIMIPQKPDKKFVYNATLSFIKEIVDFGGEVKLFKGFIHSKTVIIDNTAMLIGTANVDNRSFSLNFEISTVLYNSKLIDTYYKMIKDDFDNAKTLTLEDYKKSPFWIKMKQLFFRLFAPLM